MSDVLFIVVLLEIDILREIFSFWKSYMLR